MTYRVRAELAAEGRVEVIDVEATCACVVRRLAGRVLGERIAAGVLPAGEWIVGRVERV